MYTVCICILCPIGCTVKKLKIDILQNNIEYLQKEYKITEYFMTYLSDHKYTYFLRSNLSCIKDI